MQKPKDLDEILSVLYVVMDTGKNVPLMRPDADVSLCSGFRKCTEIVLFHFLKNVFIFLRRSSQTRTKAVSLDRVWMFGSGTIRPEEKDLARHLSEANSGTSQPCSQAEFNWWLFPFDVGFSNKLPSSYHQEVNQWPRTETKTVTEIWLHTYLHVTLAWFDCVLIPGMHAWNTTFHRKSQGQTVTTSWHCTRSRFCIRWVWLSKRCHLHNNGVRKIQQFVAEHTYT